MCIRNLSTRGLDYEAKNKDSAETRCHMKGNVRFLNLQNGLVAVETSEGFTVLEIRECCAIDLGDEITGPLDSSGTETLYNISKEECFEVSIETIHCTRVEACKLLAG